MLNGKRRVAIIGVGRMGIRHIEVAHKYGFQIVGLADRSAGALRAATTSQGLSQSVEYTDTINMLEQVKPEFVVVSTTAPSHAELVLSAVKANAKYILCEKPMACSLDEAEEMIIACRDARVKLAVNHQMRFMEQYVTVKGIIESDAMGPLCSIIVSGSNIGLAMNACHYFEMFRYITDTDVEKIHAWFDEKITENPRGIQFEDRSGRLLAFGEKGQTMYMDISGSAGHGVQSIYICRNGQICVDELTGAVRTTVRQEQYRDLPTSRYGMPAQVQISEVQPADSVMPTLGVWESMLSGTSFPEGSGSGIHALKCLVAAHESNRLGGVTVELKDADLPRQKLFRWA